MLTLVRYYSDTVLTLGHFFSGQTYVCDTLELPWVGNTPFESCIPEGTYSIKYRKSALFHIHDCYEVQNVPGRTAILIHAANTVDQLQGCIAVGVKSFSLVYTSRDTLLKLYNLIGDTDTLIIQKLVVKLMSKHVKKSSQSRKHS